MTGVILFRAQPFHNGHLNMINKAFDDYICDAK
jgi:nicotinamide mononucleotide adenylyltransferase